MMKPDQNVERVMLYCFLLLLLLTFAGFAKDEKVFSFSLVLLRVSFRFDFALCVYVRDNCCAPQVKMNANKKKTTITTKTERNVRFYLLSNFFFIYFFFISFW